ncbi:McrB family protein [Maritimibacter dapengensis]|uniref:Chromosome segregation ATPase-like protein n=1 Tax=Maritimibacter dapengensis TaxID=2836868 RepID=A0ABS6T5S6_9RHOB|nr:chromosome segregation ATPase-like protein [Maritimibacter dapengensis]MBV7380592.1 chromosome segregation ATPase-like protein [Maritimibacter dapengensis]
MLTATTLLVFVVAAVLVLLAIVMLFLANRYDQVITAQGPIATIDELKAQIDGKTNTLADLEAELDKRREAIAVVADVQVEVEALRRQKEELLLEWQSLEERRKEVQEFRLETEQAQVERLNLEAELAPMREEYNALKSRLEKAEDLIARIESLTREHGELLDMVQGMRDELRRLEEAEARVAALEERSRDLEAENARLEGRMTARESEIAEVQSRLGQEREALAAAQADHGRAGAEIAAAGQELRRQQGELEGLADTRASMEARLAHLREEIDKIDPNKPSADPLHELKETPPVIRAMLDWPKAPVQNEEDAIKRVERRLRAKGLDYPARTLRAFHTSMKVNETTQMAVLAGISGTGKSQLPRQYAAGIGIGFLQVPVQPRWDSPQDLMGFYNYIEGKFRPTDMARALWALDELNNTDAIEDRMMMILLDEMNLARVEYYFSDFLSRLESRPQRGAVGDRNERKDAEIELEIPNMDQPPRLFPGYNLLFAGTMNEDESTQSLSDKVVDRANILRFAAPKKIKDGRPEGPIEHPMALPKSTWDGWVKPSSSVEREAKVTASLDKMVDLMRDFKRPFGHRLGRAILAYAANYPRVEGSNWPNDAIADQVEMRLLPKLRGVDVDVASGQFNELRSFVEHELGDDALAQAIGDSLELAEGTGQFVWNGVTR